VNVPEPDGGVDRCTGFAEGGEAEVLLVQRLVGHGTLVRYSSLPGSTPVCYKPDMRKWMRERLKGRKKSAEEKGKGEATPAPLQPAYFHTEAPAAMPPPEVREPEAERPEREQAEAKTGEPREGQEPRPAQPQQQGERAEPRRRRRRRGRGGRGRGQAGTQPRESAPRSESPAQPSTQKSAAAVVAAPEAHARPSTATPRAPKGVVVLAIGLPGSGKSSWFKRHNITPLSSDLLRSLLFDDPTEQRFQDLIFSNLRSMLKARLIARRPMNYVDATNLTPNERHSWVKLAKDYGYEVHAVFFDVPVEVCLDRNQRRQRVVPEDVMRRMSAKLRTPTFEEGFAKITVVRVKQKD